MARGQQQQGGGGGGDNSMAPVWIMVLLMLTIYVIWSMGHTYIVRALLYANLLQAKFINFFIDDTVLSQTIQLMENMNPNYVMWDDLVQLLTLVGDYTRYPILLILMVLAFWLYQSDVTLKYRRAHDMKSLRIQEKQNWSAILPVIKLDLIDDDIAVGPWAMGQSPIEFARIHGLLKRNDALLDGTPGPGMEMTASIRRAEAKRVFTLQLGPYWNGFNRMPPHAAALAAIFMARINRDRDAAKQISEALNKTGNSTRPDYQAVWPVIRKYQGTELVQEVVQRHAYLFTVLASLLEAARNDGVVPTSELLWLKPVDRRLWYTLNCVGRQTPYCESGGIFAHWKAEKAMKRPSLVPMIDEAINALEIAIKEIKLTPKEMEELKS